MSKLIEAAEAAVGALENFVDRKVDAGEDGTGVQAIVDFLKDGIEDEKGKVNLGDGVSVSNEEFKRRLIDKIPNFNELVVAVRKDVQAGR